MQETKNISRESIEIHNNKIKLTDKDEDNDLELFCYNFCEDKDNDIIKNSRGVVFSGQKIIMQAFPYTKEFRETDFDNINQQLESSIDDCEIYDSHEGFLIRMFYYKNKWYLSTHRKLNAFKSRWASRESFGHSFKKALESEVKRNEALRKSLSYEQDSKDNIIFKFQDILDKDKQYMFLVGYNEENRVVCDVVKDLFIYHVGTFLDGKLKMNENINIPHPKKHNFKNLEEMYAYVKETDYKKIQGIILFKPNNKQYKILSADYL